MTNSNPAVSPTPALGARILAFPLTRIVVATLATVIPVAIILVGTHALLDKSLRFAWPQIVAALACVAGYRFYVRSIEKRPAAELGRKGAGRELSVGLLIGAGLLVAAIAIIALAGGYQMTGIGLASTLVSPLAEMTLVAAIEEIVFRGILFRIIERSLGSWIALIVSSAIFAAAHLPNAGISPLAVGFTFVAGLTLAAAYMATQRLWLAIGIHFAWNFTSDAIFSLTTSGHAAKGVIQGQLAGSDWLSGGSYGVEGSAISLVLFAAVGTVLIGHAVKSGHFAALRNHR